MAFFCWRDLAISQKDHSPEGQVERSQDSSQDQAQTSPSGRGEDEDHLSREQNAQPRFVSGALFLYLLCATLPLVTSTGRNFEYEYTVLLNICLMMVLPLAAALLPLPRAPHRKNHPPRGLFLRVLSFFKSPSIPWPLPWWRFFIWTLVIAPAVLLLPGAIAFGLEFCSCSKEGFVFWFALNVLPTIALSHALSFHLFRLRIGRSRQQTARKDAAKSEQHNGPAGDMGKAETSTSQVESSPQGEEASEEAKPPFSERRFFSVLLFLCFWLLVLVGTFFWLWYFPQKRMNHPFFGFLAGPIYDSLLSLDESIVASRGALWLLSLGLLLFHERPRGVLRRMAATSLVLLAASWGGMFFLTSPSVSHGEWALQEKLRGMVDESETTGFVLYYDYPKEAGARRRQIKEAPRRIQALVREAQFHVEEIAQFFGISLPLKETIRIYVYPDGRRKKLWFGAGASTDVTDVKGPTVHITLRPEISGPHHPTLRHELVHAITAPSGYYGLGFHPAVAITEGLAIALAPERRALDLHTAASFLLSQKKLRDVNDLFSPLFWRYSGSQAYAVSGSFLLFLHSRFGGASLLRLYGGASFEKSFGRPKKELISEWTRLIEGRYVAGRDGLLAEKLYSEPSLFDKRCPHTKALRSLPPGHKEAFVDFWRLGSPVKGKAPKTRDASPRLKEQLRHLKKDLATGYQREVSAHKNRRRPEEPSRGASREDRREDRQGDRREDRRGDRIRAYAASKHFAELRETLRSLVQPLLKASPFVTPKNVSELDALMMWTDLLLISEKGSEAEKLLAGLEALTEKKSLGHRGRAIKARSLLWKRAQLREEDVAEGMDKGLKARFSAKTQKSLLEWQAYLSGLEPMPPKKPPQKPAKKRAKKIAIKKAPKSESTEWLFDYLRLRRGLLKASSAEGERRLKNLLAECLPEKPLGGHEERSLPAPHYRLELECFVELEKSFYEKKDYQKAREASTKALRLAKKGERAYFKMKERLFFWLIEKG